MTFSPFGALAFSSYGAFWMSFWYLVSHAKDLPTTGTDAAKGIGVFLLAWTIFTLYMTVVASRLSGLLFILSGDRGAAFYRSDLFEPPGLVCAMTEVAAQGMHRANALMLRASTKESPVITCDLGQSVSGRIAVRRVAVVLSSGCQARFFMHGDSARATKGH